MKRLSLFRKKPTLTLPGEVAIVTGLLAGFVAIASATISASSIWFDEAFGAYLIRFDFAQIFHYTSLDVHPPFYYWLLKVWSLVFGDSDVALRSMSVLFAVVALVFAYLIVRRLFSRRAALWTLGLLVISPFFVRYAQEARMYTLVAAIAMAATYILTFAVTEKKWKWWILYGTLVSLGMWTHYFMALVWLSHWVWRAIDVYRPHIKAKLFLQQFFSKQWIAAHVTAIGLFALWLPSLVFQLVDVQSHGFWIPPIDPSTVPSYVTTILYYLTANETSPWLTIALIVTSILWIVVSRHAYRTLKPAVRRWFALLASMAVAPVALLLIGSLPPLQSSFMDRYLLSASVALVMVSGILVAYVPRNRRAQWLRNGLVVLLIGSMVIGIGNVYRFGNFNKSTGEKSAAKQLVAQVTEVSAGSEPIIADSPWLFYDAVQYSTDQHTVYFIDALTEYRYGSLEMLRTNDMFKIKDLKAFDDAHQFIWYIDLGKDQTATPPDTSWKAVDTISLSDPYTGKPAYHAVRYQTF